MKITRLSLAVLLIASCLGLSSCSKTKYYIPNVVGTYASTTYEKFVEEFEKNVKIDYDYFAMEIEMEKPEYYYPEKSFTNTYYVGYMDETAIGKGQDYIENKVYNRVSWKHASPQSGNGTSSIVGSALTWAYNFVPEGTYTTLPYSYTLNGIKIIYDNNFLVSSIEVDMGKVSNNQTQNMAVGKLKYFNEKDLPKSGSIDRDTYQEVASVLSNKVDESITECTVEFDYKNTVLSSEKYFNGETGYWDYNNTVGDLKIKAKYNITVGGLFQGNKSLYYHLGEYEIISGEVQENLIQQKLYLDFQPMLYPQFVLPFMGYDLEDETICTYSLNPLTATAKNKDTKVTAKCNENGYLTYYYIENVNGQKMTAKLTYA